MPTVVVINGRHKGEWYTVPETTRGLVVGRSQDLLAEIIDPRVSQEHMRIYRDARTDAFVIEDLGSRNGTRVNGQKVQLHDMAEGDLIQVGYTLMGYTHANVEKDEDLEAFIDAMRAKAGSTLEHIESREPYTEAAAMFSRIFRKPGSKDSGKPNPRGRKPR